MTSIALPRIKVKKRKRRPPNRREKMAIFACSVQAVIILFDVVVLLAFWPRSTIQLFSLIVSIFIFWRCWPCVVEYIRNGFEDD